MKKKTISLTIDLPSEQFHASLRKQAGQNGRSVEEEIVMILRRKFPLAREKNPDEESEKGIGDAIHELFAGTGGLKGLEMLPREQEPKPSGGSHSLAEEVSMSDEFREDPIKNKTANAPKKRNF